LQPDIHFFSEVEQADSQSIFHRDAQGLVGKVGRDNSTSAQFVQFVLGSIQEGAQGVSLGVGMIQVSLVSGLMLGNSTSVLPNQESPHQDSNPEQQNRQS